MNRIKVMALSATLVLAVGAMSGCSWAQKGAGAGGVVGGVAGAIVGHNSSHISTAAGAISGTGGGAAIGGLAGDAYAATDRKDMERELDNLAGQLQAAESELAMLRESGLTKDKLAQLDQLKIDLDNAQNELNAKRAALDDMASKYNQASSELTQKNADLGRAEADLQATKGRLGELDGQIDRMDQDLQNTTVARDEAESRARELQARLASAQDQLAKVSDKLNVMETSLREKDAAVDKLRADLKDLNVQLEETSRGLTLTIMNQLLYTPGNADLSDGGAELIAKVADILKTNFPNRELVVEGHTDNVPIKSSGWTSNWELGAARSLAVVHELVERHGFDPDKMSATSFGEHRPTASNSTDAGRSQNRRAVIVILPEKMPLQRNQYASSM